VRGVGANKARLGRERARSFCRKKASSRTFGGEASASSGSFTHSGGHPELEKCRTCEDSRGTYFIIFLWER
jgi:hypothetical protein